jgi:hypothetical protein
MGHGINYVSKNFVTCALIRNLLQQAEGITRMSDTMCVENYVNKPIQKRYLKDMAI